MLLGIVSRALTSKGFKVPIASYCIKKMTKSMWVGDLIFNSINQPVDHGLTGTGTLASIFVRVKSHSLIQQVNSRNAVTVGQPVNVSVRGNRNGLCFREAGGETQHIEISSEQLSRSDQDAGPTFSSPLGIGIRGKTQSYKVE